MARSNNFVIHICLLLTTFLWLLLNEWFCGKELYTLFLLLYFWWPLTYIHYIYSIIICSLEWARCTWLKVWRPWPLYLCFIVCLCVCWLLRVYTCTAWSSHSCGRATPSKEGRGQQEGSGVVVGTGTGAEYPHLPSPTTTPVQSVLE